MNNSQREPESQKLLQLDSNEFVTIIQRRRSVRRFSTTPVSHEIIENCIRAVASAPSGANLQPWHFVVVPDPGIKKDL